MARKLIKEARILKRKGKYCVVGHKKNKSGNYHSFGCYNTKEEAEGRLNQVRKFKHIKSSIISTMHEISGVLYERGIIHVADALTNCINCIIQNDSREQIATKLGKIIPLLQKRGEGSLTERLEQLIPEILVLEKIDCEVERPVSTKYRISAQRAYNIATLLKKKYLEGEIDENDFEYEKMRELESLLKAGFILPMPKSYKELPGNTKNWWDHFSKG